MALARPSRTRLLVLLAVAAVLSVLVAANAHLVYVAVTSQPDCVSHTKSGSADKGAYSAARSAC
jgi:hypothetical protein